MPSLVFSPAAQRDLSTSWDYTEKTWGIEQATAYTRNIQRTCNGLITGDTISRDAGAIRAGYRKAAVGRHVIFLKLEASGDIEIVRILHSQMDFDRHI